MEGLTPSKIKAFPCFQIFQQAMIELHEDIPAWVQHLEQGGHAYSCPLKVYGPKWHNLSSSGCQISILRVRRSKWHLGTSWRAAGVFNSLTNVHAHLVITIMIVPKESSDNTEE